ncbi:protein FAM98B [Sergentomyia squamirostris]
MNADFIEALECVGYTGNCNAVFQEKTLNDESRQLLVWLTDEIRVLGNIDEKLIDDGDLESFRMTLSSFLKEMKCPFTSLTDGMDKNRFNTVESRSLLFNFLIDELMALKMVAANKPKDTSNVITLKESPTAAALKELALGLGMGKPPENFPCKAYFDKIDSRLVEVMQKAGPKRVGKPLFNPTNTLTGEQWQKLLKLQQELDLEYDLRRKMLLTRLDCTVQSFQWSDRLKNKGDEIYQRYNLKRSQLDSLQTGGKSTDISALLAARDNLLIMEKTSSAAVRRNTRSKIQRHIIGQVPDRGGRAWEHAPPPPEMPSWQKNRATGGGFGGGRGGGRGGGGQRGGGGGFHQNQNFSNYQQPQQQYSNYQSQSNNPNNQYFDNRSDGGHYRGGGEHHRGRGGGSRVQGGWSEKGSDNYRRDNYGNRNQQQDYSDQQNYRGQNQGNFNQGGGYNQGYHQGRPSNNYRGGRRN